MTIANGRLSPSGSGGASGSAAGVLVFNSRFQSQEWIDVISQAIASITLVDAAAPSHAAFAPS